jgi:MerR family transcriptional regulator, light-induced transcriptional regulator
VDLQTAAERLGVHYQTAYRWVRDGSIAAVKVGSTYEIAEHELERFIDARSRPAPPPSRTVVRSWASQVQRLYLTLSIGDELGARQVIDRLADGGVPPLDICENLVAPTMRKIGDDWAAGAITVAEEHRASAIAARLLARFAAHPRGRPRGVVIVGTPPTEQHGLPAAMAAVVLRADRWKVHHLDVQVPLEDLVAMIRSCSADLVVLSLTWPDGLSLGERFVDAVREEVRVPVLVGRPGDSLSDLVEGARSVRSRVAG